MIGTIRKHSKVLWWVVIVAIIVTFVIWQAQPPQAGGGSGGSSGSLGRINGENITPKKFRDARHEVFLIYFFGSRGSWPDKGRPVSGFDVEKETYLRLILIQKQAEMGVHVSEEVLAKVANEQLHARWLNRGNPLPPDLFANQVLAPQGLTLDDFARYIRHEIGIQQIASVLGLGGELLSAKTRNSRRRRPFSPPPIISLP
jgi:hypothetical protein